MPRISRPHGVYTCQVKRARISDIMEFPLCAYLTCAEAHTALGENDKARKAIEAGYQELLARADKISQVEWGRSFLLSVAEHRTFIELWEGIAQ